MRSAMYFEMRSFELNELIEKTYNVKNFNCALGLPNSNTALKESNINKEYSDKMRDSDYIKEIMANGDCEYDQITFILWDMCSIGAIPDGNYLIDCSY